MSKNSPRQTYLAVKEWLQWMKFKPRAKKQPEYESYTKNSNIYN